MELFKIYTDKNPVLRKKCENFRQPFLDEDKKLLKSMVEYLKLSQNDEYAKKYKLPQVIQNFILQHHGEGLATYFYNQAVEEEGAENVKEEQFRYSGPKPNTKETAILMIADAVESAVRSLKNPTPEEIEKMIDKIIIERLNDTQLSDSPLTLKDLKTIAATFSRILRGMQHNRIKYQENAEKEFDKIMPSKLLDTDLENKIKQLEDGKPADKPSDGEKDDKN